MQIRENLCLCTNTFLYDMMLFWVSQWLNMLTGANVPTWEEAPWRHLANTTKPSVCGDDAVLCQLLRPPYFYYRSTWPTVLESVSRVLPSLWKFPPSLNWYDHPLPSYSDRLLLTIQLRDLDLLTLVSGHTWRVTRSTHPLSLKLLRYLFLSYEFRH